MTKSSTLIYLVNKFQYKEPLPHVKSAEEKIDNLLTGMGNAGSAPSKQSIKNIMDFARSYEVMETEKAGYVEMNLN